MNGMLILAHILIGFYFIFFGFWNIYHWTPIMEVLLRKKMPSPFFVLSIAIAWQIICGTMIMFGILVKIAALLLVPFVVFIVIILHPFWEFQGELRKQHMALFITNFTMCLGALSLLIGL